jgi:hypothetical protein
MVELVDNCELFSDFGFKGKIYIPKTIYGDFVENFENLMILVKISGYNIVCNYSFGHNFKFIKDGNRLFTLQIYNSHDNFHVSLNLSIFYHFHHDYSQQKDMNKKLSELFSDFKIDDNMISCESEDEIIKGLKLLHKVV